MGNLKFKNSQEGKAQNVPPIWFMRQAGRYHQHYQKLRAKHSFMDLCKIPELAAEVAWGPVADFDFDVSILFSDLLFPLEALGMGLTYTDQGPRLGYHLDEHNLGKLAPISEALPQLQFQAQALELTRAGLAADKSLIGFVGGPWTLFVYAVEGGHSGSLIQSKTQPQLWQGFLQKMLPLLKANIKLQLAAGAEIVMIFDTAAGEVSPGFFKEFLEPSLVALANEFPRQVGYYSKGTQARHFSENFLKLPWAGMGIDHRWDMAHELAKQHPGFLQGNFDQALLHLPHETFKQSLAKWLRPLQELSPEARKSWVCGLGHGVLPKTPEENVRYFVNFVRETLK